MIESSSTSTLLVEELQLGEQLSHCIHTNRRSDFALMLAMLTDDVRAHSQFHLPQSQVQTIELDEQRLRKMFELPEKPRLALTDLKEINEFSQAELIEQQQLTTLHLQQAMKPQPLAFRDDSKHIDVAVMTNTSLYCQQQHKLQHASAEDKRREFNANEWLKAVQTTIVKSPLIAVAA